MSHSDAEVERLAHAEYWDEHYKQTRQGGRDQVHEWYLTFQELQDYFTRHLFASRPPRMEPRILHLGSGDSTVPQELASLGYNSQLCIDFSAVVVETMSRRHANMGLSPTSSIQWQQMDVRCMEECLLPTASVDVAFDKGTLDAMIHGSPWSPPDDVLRDTGDYLREVARVLKPDGVFLYVTYRQPHFIRPLLECQGTNWDVDIEILGKGGSIGYSGAVCKPRRA